MKGIRLSEYYIQTICDVFRRTFPSDNHLWLFGSRTDLSKRGGDIDLYIETTLTDVAKIVDAQYAFVAKLEAQLGEQKIDVVIKYDDRDLPIYDIARNEGIQLV